MIMVLIVLLLLGAFGSVPQWGYHNYGYGPSGIIGVVLIILLILYLTGHKF